MWNFYNKHKTYDHTDEKELKNHLSAAYQAGRNGKEKVEATDALRAKAVTNIAALNRTLELFPDLNPARTLVRLTRERLAQEQKWLAHYDKCIDATKRGHAELVAAAKGLTEEAFASGKADMEKHIKARVQEERATAARMQAEAIEKQRSEREKNNQNRDKQHDREHNNHDKNRNQNNDKNKGDRRVNVVIEKMVLKEVDDNKKGNKKHVKKFHQLKE